MADLGEWAWLTYIYKGRFKFLPDLGRGKRERIILQRQFFAGELAFSVVKGLFTRD